MGTDQPVAYNTDEYSLPPGTRLNNQKYLVQKVLGQGGFGITYLGWDDVLAMPVAVKEFYPQNAAGGRMNRQENDSIHVNGSEDRKVFEKGIDDFFQEARALARFGKLEGIVQVRDYFRENGTAYIVMEYVEGISVKKYVQDNGPIPAEQVLELLKPVLQSLYAIHEWKLIHRDLSPDNLLITEQGKLKLVDFGAARYVSIEQFKTMTCSFKRGFSAYEQYGAKGQQGAWTDVYGISATMYYMITGQVLEEAVDRMVQDDVTPLSEMPELSVPEAVSQAISKGMAVMWEDRYQSIKELYQDIYGEEIPVSGQMKPYTGEIASSGTVKLGMPAGSQVKKQREPSTVTLGRELQQAIISQFQRANEIVKKKRKTRILFLLGICVVVCMSVFVVEQVRGGHFLSAGNQEGTSPDSTPSDYLRNDEENPLENFSKDNTGDNVDKLSDNQLTNTGSGEVEKDAQEQKVKLPDVAGYTRKKAKKKLERLGLANIVFKKRYSNSVKKGKVIRQSIKSGSKIAKDRKVKLYISMGAKKTAGTSSGQGIDSQPGTTRPPAITSSEPQPKPPAQATQKPSNSGSSGKEQKGDGGVAGSLDSVLD